MSKFKLHYEIIGQDAIGSAGSLEILWNPEEIQFENLVSVPRIISGKFRNIGSQEWVLLSSVYGPHILGKCKIFLPNLETI